MHWLPLKRYLKEISKHCADAIHVLLSIRSWISVIVNNRCQCAKVTLQRSLQELRTYIAEKVCSDTKIIHFLTIREKVGECGWGSSMRFVPFLYSSESIIICHHILMQSLASSAIQMDSRIRTTKRKMVRTKESNSVVSLTSLIRRIQHSRAHFENITKSVCLTQVWRNVYCY